MYVQILHLEKSLKMCDFSPGKPRSLVFVCLGTPGKTVLKCLYEPHGRKQIQLVGSVCMWYVNVLFMFLEWLLHWQLQQCSAYTLACSGSPRVFERFDNSTTYHKRLQLMVCRVITFHLLLHLFSGWFSGWPLYQTRMSSHSEFCCSGRWWRWQWWQPELWNVQITCTEL